MNVLLFFILLITLTGNSALSAVSIWIEKDKNSRPLTIIKPPPKSPIIVPDPSGPAANYVWVKGYWRLLGKRWIWVDGYWQPNPPPPKIWVSGHWVRVLILHVFLFEFFT